MRINGIYHIGSRFFVNKNYIDRNNLLNKKVRIVEHDINSKSGTKEKYPYFACKVKLVSEQLERHKHNVLFFIISEEINTF